MNDNAEQFEPDRISTPDAKQAISLYKNELKGLKESALLSIKNTDQAIRVTHEAAALMEVGQKQIIPILDGEEEIDPEERFKSEVTLCVLQAGAALLGLWMAELADSWNLESEDNGNSPPLEK